MGRRTPRVLITASLALAGVIAVLIAAHTGSPRPPAPATAATGAPAVVVARTPTAAPGVSGASGARASPGGDLAGSGATGHATVDIGLAAPGSVGPASVPRAVAATPAGATVATSAAARALPGASVSIVRAPAGVGDVVAIAAPAGAFAQPGGGRPGFPTGSPAHTVNEAAWRYAGDSAVPDASAAGTAGWRAGMIGAYAAANDASVVGWTLAASGVPISAQAQNYLHANVRISPGTTIGWPSQTLIGQVRTVDAQRQLDSNLAVLGGVLGPDLVAIATSVVPVGPSTFGLEADLKVTSLVAIAPHITDVWLGLATGLVSGPESTIEGLAINLVDESGARASEWANGRDGDGGGVGNPALPLVTSADAAFPDLTGGPALQAARPSTLPVPATGENYVREK